jgi:hypothetical protein
MEGKLPRKLLFSFLPIPEELMKSKAISWGAKYLWGIYAKANKERVTWSAKYLSERMGCEVREVRKRKAELIENNLIIVNPRKGRVDEVSINLQLVHIIQENTPVQMDRGVQTGQGRDGQTGQGNSKEHSLKNTMSAKPTDWNFDDKLKEMTDGNRRDLQVIALYWKEIGFKFENEAQYQPALKRELRPAKTLIGYKDEDILETIRVLKNTDYLKKFTLETIHKFIDSVVAQKKKTGPRIIKFEEIVKPDGRKVMRPIYAK